MDSSVLGETTNGQSEKGDIRTIEDVRLLVDTFYGRARLDELVGPIFNDTIQDRWPEHLAKIFTQFSRIDNPLTRDVQGTGLGLYITRELCRANDATLDYVDRSDGSSCFRIVLPDPRAMLPA